MTVRRPDSAARREPQRCGWPRRAGARRTARSRRPCPTTGHRHVTSTYRASSRCASGALEAARAGAGEHGDGREDVLVVGRRTRPVDVPDARVEHLGDHAASSRRPRGPVRPRLLAPDDGDPLPGRNSAVDPVRGPPVERPRGHRDRYEWSADRETPRRASSRRPPRARAVARARVRDLSQSPAATPRTPRPRVRARPSSRTAAATAGAPPTGTPRCTPGDRWARPQRERGTRRRRQARQPGAGQLGGGSRSRGRRTAAGRRRRRIARSGSRVPSTSIEALHDGDASRASRTNVGSAIAAKSRSGSGARRRSPRPIDDHRRGGGDQRDVEDEAACEVREPLAAPRRAARRRTFPTAPQPTRRLPRHERREGGDEHRSRPRRSSGANRRGTRGAPRAARRGA